MSQDLTRLSTSAVDVCDDLMRLQELIKMCAEQVFASPALAPETMRERVGLLLNAYLDEVPDAQIDLKLTLEQVQQDIDRVSEFQGVRNGVN